MRWNDSTAVVKVAPGHYAEKRRLATERARTLRAQVTAPSPCSIAIADNSCYKCHGRIDATLGR
jgi:hypothetical protein